MEDTRARARLQQAGLRRLEEFKKKKQDKKGNAPDTAQVFNPSAAAAANDKATTSAHELEQTHRLAAATAISSPEGNASTPGNGARELAPEHLATSASASASASPPVSGVTSPSMNFLHAELAQLRVRVQQAEARAAEAEEKVAQFQSSGSVSNSSTGRQDVEIVIQKLEQDLKKGYEDASKLEQELQGVREENASLTDQLKRTNEHCKVVEGRVGELEEQLGGMQSSTQSSLEAAAKNVSNTKNRMAELEDLVDQYQGLAEQRGLESKALETELARLQAEKDADSALLADAVAKAQEGVAKAYARIEQLESELQTSVKECLEWREQYNAASQDLATTRERLEVVKTELVKVEEEMEQMQATGGADEEIAKLKMQLEKANEANAASIVEVAKLKKDCTKLKSELASSQRQITESNDEARKFKHEAQAMETKLAVTLQRANIAEGEIEQVKSECNELREYKKRVEKLLEQKAPDVKKVMKECVKAQEEVASLARKLAEYEKKKDTADEVVFKRGSGSEASKLRRLAEVPSFDSEDLIRLRDQLLDMQQQLKVKQSLESGLDSPTGDGQPRLSRKLSAGGVQALCPILEFVLTELQGETSKAVAMLTDTESKVKQLGEKLAHTEASLLESQAHLREVQQQYEEAKLEVVDVRDKLKSAVKKGKAIEQERDGITVERAKWQEACLLVFQDLFKHASTIGDLVSEPFTGPTVDQYSFDDVAVQLTGVSSAFSARASKVAALVQQVAALREQISVLNMHSDDQSTEAAKLQQQVLEYSEKLTSVEKAFADLQAANDELLVQIQEHQLKSSQDSQELLNATNELTALHKKTQLVMDDLQSTNVVLQEKTATLTAATARVQDLEAQLLALQEEGTNSTTVLSSKLQELESTVSELRQQLQVVGSEKEKLQTQLQSAQQEAEQSRSKLNRLDKELSSMKASKADLEKILSRSTEEAAAKAAELHCTAVSVGALKDQINTLSAKNEELQRQLVAQAAESQEASALKALVDQLQQDLVAEKHQKQGLQESVESSKTTLQQQSAELAQLQQNNLQLASELELIQQTLANSANEATVAIDALQDRQRSDVDQLSEQANQLKSVADILQQALLGRDEHISELQQLLSVKENELSESLQQLQDIQASQADRMAFAVAQEATNLELLRGKAEAEAKLAQLEEEQQSQCNQRETRAHELEVVCAGLQAELEGIRAQLQSCQLDLQQREHTEMQLLDDLHSARDDLAVQEAAVKELESNVSMLQQELEALQGVLAAKSAAVVELQQARTSLQAELAGHEQDLETARQHVEQLQAQLKALEVAEEAVQQLRAAEVAALKEQHGQRSQEYEAALSSLQQELDEHKSALEREASAKAELERCLQGSEDKLTRLRSTEADTQHLQEQKNQEYEAVINSLQEALDDWKAAAGAHKAENAELQQQVVRCEEALSQAQAAEAALVVQQQQAAEEHEAVVAHWKHAMEESSAALESQKAQIAGLQQQLQSAEEALSQLRASESDLQAKKQEYEAAVSGLQAELDGLNAALTALKAENGELRQQLSSSEEALEQLRASECGFQELEAQLRKEHEAALGRLQQALDDSQAVLEKQGGESAQVQASLHALEEELARVQAVEAAQKQQLEQDKVMISNLQQLLDNSKAAAESRAAEVAALQEQLEQGSATISNLQQALGDSEAAADSHAAEVTVLQQQLQGAEEMLRQLRLSESGLQKEYQVTIEGLQQALDECKAALESHKSANMELQAMMQNAQETNMELMNQVEDLRSFQAELGNKEDELLEMQQLAESRAAELSKAQKRIEKLQGQLLQLEETLLEDSGRTQEVEDLQHKLALAKEDESALQAAREQLEAQVEKLQEQLGCKDRELQAAVGKLASVELDLAAAMEKVASGGLELEAAAEKLASLNTELEQAYQSVGDYKGKLKAAVKKGKGIEEQKKALEEQVAALEAKLVELQEAAHVMDTASGNGSGGPRPLPKIVSTAIQESTQSLQKQIWEATSKKAVPELLARWQVSFLECMTQRLDMGAAVQELEEAVQKLEASLQETQQQLAGKDLALSQKDEELSAVSQRAQELDTGKDEALREKEQLVAQHVTRIADLERQLSALEKHRARVEQLESAMEDAQAGYEALQTSKEALESSLAQLQGSYQQLQTELSSAQAQMAKVAKAKEESDTMVLMKDAELARVVAQISRLDTSAENVRQQMTGELEEARKQTATLQAQVTQLTSELSKERAQLGDRATKAEAELTQLRAETEAVQAALADATADLAKVRKQAQQEAQRAGGAEQQLQELQGRCEDLSAELAKLQVQSGALTALQAEKAALQSQVSSLSSRLKELENQNDELNGQLIGMQVQLDAADAKRSAESQHAKELAAARQQLHEKDAALEALQGSVAADQAKLRQARELIQKMQAERSSAASRVEDLQTQLAQVNAAKDRLHQMYMEVLNQSQSATSSTLQRDLPVAAQPPSNTAEAEAAVAALEAELAAARVQAEGSAERCAALEQQLESSESHCAGLGQQAQEAQQRCAELAQQLSEAEAQHGALQLQLGEAHARCSELEAALQSSANDSSALERRLHAMEDHMSQVSSRSPAPSQSQSEIQVSGLGTEQIVAAVRQDINVVSEILGSIQDKASNVVQRVSKSMSLMAEAEPPQDVPSTQVPDMQALVRLAAALDGMMGLLEGAVAQLLRELQSRSEQLSAVPQLQAFVQTLERENSNLHEELRKVVEQVAKGRETGSGGGALSPQSSGPREAGSEIAPFITRQVAASALPPSKSASFRPKKKRDTDIEAGHVEDDGHDDHDATVRKISVEYRPLATVPYLRTAHPRLRSAVTNIDKWSMVAGTHLTAKPMVRVGVYAYVLFLHLMLWFSTFMHSCAPVSA